MSGSRSLVVAVAIVAIVALVASGCVWNFQTLDGHQDGPNGRVMANLGQDNAAIADGSKVRFFSWDATNLDLQPGRFG